MTNTIKFAAAYIRVSSDRQDEYSPDSQLKLIREYAEREGYYVPDEFVFYDDGISARSAKKRTEFNRMIAMAKEKDSPFQAILVWKFSRFARNREESMVFKNLLRKRGIKVLSVSEPIPEDHYGTLLESIIEWYDEFYSINLGVEVRRGMTEKASRGEPTCAPAFGYIIEDKKYYPDRASGAADIVVEIFERFASGEGMRTIALSLNSRGILTKFGNKWEARGIEYVLNNPVYIGKIRWSLDGTQQVHNRNFSGENILVADGDHESLISVELWERVQKRLQELKRIYPKHARREIKTDYMLKGLIRCSNCGGTLTGCGKSGKAQKLILQCCNYAHATCNVSHSILYERIETAFLEGMQRAISESHFEIEAKPQGKSKKLVTDYDKIIESERRRLDRAKQAYLNEIDTIEQYAETKKAIEAHIAELESERRRIVQSETVDLDKIKAKVISVLSFLQDENVSVEAKNEALKSIISRIVYEKAKGNVAIYFYSN